eukprot:jgi/Mesvir1/6833/Mv09014-RA.1
MRPRISLSCNYNLGKLRGVLTCHHVEVLDDDVKAALGELGLLAEVERLLLELCCDGGGGGGGVLPSMSAQTPWVGGASPAGPAGAGLAATSFTACMGGA